MVDTFADTDYVRRLRGDFESIEFDEEAACGSLLEVAASVVRHSFPRVDADIAAGRVALPQVQWIVYRLVSDVLNNPERYVAEGILDVQYRFDAAMVRGQMSLTADEKKQLRPAGAVSPVGTARGSVWCP